MYLITNKDNEMSRGLKMKKGENYNHPQKGETIKVEPIKDVKDIRLIRKILLNKPLDLALFVVGINTNLRASDLLRIAYRDVKDAKPGDELELKEKKTGKLRRITLNKACIEAIQGLISSRQYEEKDLLFLGQRGPVTVAGLHGKVKKWCREVNLKGNYGSHTLRKTWGYHQRVTFKEDLIYLTECFNHSSQRQTLDYLCIQPEEKRQIYMNEL